MSLAPLVLDVGIVLILVVLIVKVLPLLFQMDRGSVSDDRDDGLDAYDEGSVPDSSDSDADLDDTHPGDAHSKAADAVDGTTDDVPLSVELWPAGVSATCSAQQVLHRRTSNVQRKFVAAAKQVPIGEKHTYHLGYLVTREEATSVHAAFAQLKKDNAYWLEMEVKSRFEDHKIATWIAFTRLR